MKKLLLFALFLGLAVPSYATTWYVATTGSDSLNNCTAAQTITTPKLTITAALACVGSAGTDAGASDTVQVAAGTYNESLIDVIPNGSGTGARFTLTCATNLACIINPSSSYGIGFGSLGAHWIVVNGFKVDSGPGESGIYTSSNTYGFHHDIFITNNEFDGNNQRGLGTSFSGVDRLTFSGNYLHDYGNAPYGFDCTTNGYCVGGYFASHTRDGIVSNNVFANNSGYNVQLYSDVFPPENYVVSGNTFRGSIVASGLVVYGTGHLIYNNIFTDNAFEGLRLWGNAEVYFNTIYNNSNNGSESNGGILDPGGGGICKNNIVFGNTGGQSDCASETNSFETDPHFVNAAIGDFHLLDTSGALPPCGVAIGGITTDKDGETRPNPPSCGAFEVPSGSNPADPLAETFDAYTATSSIDTLNGGAGWTTDWELVQGTVTVETAPAWMSGKSLRQNSTTVSEARRFFAAHSGVFSIFFNVSLSTTPNDYIVVSAMAPSGGFLCRINFDTAGDLYVETALLDAAITTNHSYAVEMNFDTANQVNKCRAKIDGGSYSSWMDTAAPLTSIAGLAVSSYATNAHTFWLDNISDEVGVGGSGTITNVTPIAGQVCISGSTCSITWGSNGITGAVNVYYLVGGNQYLIASPDVTATPYTWTVNAPAGTTIKTRVSQGGVSSDSGDFTVRGTKTYFK